MQNARLTYKDVGRKETVQELYCLKAWQISKDYARSREITNEPYTSLNYENTDKKLVFVVQLQTLHEISHRKNTFEELNW
jgi:hypothetical protein